MLKSLKGVLGSLLKDVFCPGDLADRLIAEGVKGTPSNPTYCPLATYLSAEVKYPVEVYRNQVAACDVYVDLPEVVGQFLSNFDCGQYAPELRRQRPTPGV